MHVTIPCLPHVEYPCVCCTCLEVSTRLLRSNDSAHVSDQLQRLLEEALKECVGINLNAKVSQGVKPHSRYCFVIAFFVFLRDPPSHSHLARRPSPLVNFDFGEYVVWYFAALFHDERSEFLDADVKSKDHRKG